MALTAYPPIMLHMQCFASKGNKKANASSGRKQVEKEFVDEKGRELLSPVHEKWLVDMQRCSEDDFNYALVDEILKEEVEKLKEALSKLTIFKATPTLLDHVRISFDGTEVGIKSLGHVIVKTPQCLSVRVYDESTTKVIAKELKDRFERQLWTVETDGKINVDVTLPKNTPLLRESLLKSVKDRMEISRNGIRFKRDKIFREWNKIKADFPKNDAYNIEQQIQKRCSAVNEVLAELLKKKKKELELS